MRPHPMRLTARPTQRIGMGPPPQGTTDPYLLTKEHRAWAAAVLKRAGYRCEWKEGGLRCSKAAPLHRMFADHIVERRDNPSRARDLGNGQCLCGHHHQLKTHRERAKRMSR